LDLRLPEGLERGRWQMALELLDRRDRVVERLRVDIFAHGFDLPRSRNVALSASLPWDRLQAVWPRAFAELDPLNVSRGNPWSAEAVRLLDSMVRQAAAHRMELRVPELAPVVKWPAGAGPEVDWQAYDSVVTPWLEGGLFLGLPGATRPQAWPIPRMRHLSQYPPESRQQYWRLAMQHFADRGWLERSRAWLTPADAGASAVRVRRGEGFTPAERAKLSAEAARLVKSFPVGQIALPLNASQTLFAGPGYPVGLPPEAAGRLSIRAGSTVTRSGGRRWPAGLDQPGRWLDAPEGDLTTVGTLNAPVAAVSEADLRVWGWLAYLRGADLVRLGPVLPPADVGQDIRRPADPSRLIAFYPGEPFGLDTPVPTVHLKWLRRAQQDVEYLHAAADRQEGQYARLLARAMARPLEVNLGPDDLRPDPVYPLLTGTPGRSLWPEALQLVAEKTAIGDPVLQGMLPDRFVTDHTNRTTTWLSRREVPTPVVRQLSWGLISTPSFDQFGQPDPRRLERRVSLVADLAVYNPSDATPEGFAAGWSTLPGGAQPSSETAGLWRPAAVEVPLDAPDTYELTTVALSASAGVDDLARRFGTSQQSPARFYVRNAYRDSLSGPGVGRRGFVQAVAPAVVVDRRDAAPTLDGSLGDWEGDEAIVDGPLTVMQSRPDLRRGDVRRADLPAQVFAGWTAEGLHLGFRFEGLAPQPEGIRSARTFIETQHRRAWGEDLCQLVVQPIYESRGETELGPAVHVVLKPSGNAFAQIAVDRRTNELVWQDVQANLPYSTTVEQATGIWRGEITLPWSALQEGPRTVRSMANVPAMLRFNVSQHVADTGESASWAGPVDHGRDASITGALILRKPRQVGIESTRRE
ncbi:MAG: hypothetical protein AAGK78_00335, partial [Planctomycetota bacterium]